jgi:hypothetical protein
VSGGEVDDVANRRWGRAEELSNQKIVAGVDRSYSQGAIAFFPLLIPKEGRGSWLAADGLQFTALRSLPTHHRTQLPWKVTTLVGLTKLYHPIGTVQGAVTKFVRRC